MPVLFDTARTEIAIAGGGFRSSQQTRPKYVLPILRFGGWAAYVAGVFCSPAKGANQPPASGDWPYTRSPSSVFFPRLTAKLGLADFPRSFASSGGLFT